MEEEGVGSGACVEEGWGIRHEWREGRQGLGCEWTRGGMSGRGEGLGRGGFRA